MPINYAELQEGLRQRPRTWLITGVAGFIGSNLLEALLGLEQQVVGLDSFVGGRRQNLDDVRRAVGEARWARFRLIEGDVARYEDCREALRGVELVLHHAAFVSVPASLEDPLRVHESNVTGFLNLLVAAREAGVSRLVYAATSASYGDDPALKKVEGSIGRQLSPYALTKLVDELYAETFARLYGLDSVGLRYFNIFGPRQDPAGAYAAVIPRWIDALLCGGDCHIYGDGETTRDFCYVANVVQANLLAALCDQAEALNQVYNIGMGGRTTLNDLYRLIRDGVIRKRPALEPGLKPPRYGPERPGDIRHSQADVGKAERLLGYRPQVSVAEGLERTLDWHLGRTPAASAA